MSIKLIRKMFFNCHDCGYDGEIQIDDGGFPEECPICGSNNFDID